MSHLKPVHKYNAQIDDLLSSTDNSYLHEE